MREQKLVIRVSPTEKLALAALAEGLQRSRSDTVRWLIREAANELRTVNPGDRRMPAGGSPQ